MARRLPNVMIDFCEQVLDRAVRWMHGVTDAASTCVTQICSVRLVGCIRRFQLMIYCALLCSFSFTSSSARNMLSWLSCRTSTATLLLNMHRAWPHGKGNRVPLGPAIGRTMRFYHPNSKVNPAKCDSSNTRSNRSRWQTQSSCNAIMVPGQLQHRFYSTILNNKCCES